MDSLRTGVFTISLDTELAWGTNARGEWRRVLAHLQNSRRTVRELLRLFDQYRIPATWAVVGHLFLSHCSADGGYPHPDVLVPEVPGMAHWHEFDPASTLAEAPLWYGADIIRAIRDCPQPQEIGCHTFTHVAADDVCSEEIFRSQVGKCVEVAAKEGIALRSFVYPRNLVAFPQVLREFGFTSFRGRQAGWCSQVRGRSRRLARFTDQALAITPPTYRLPAPARLVELKASMLLISTDGIRRRISMPCRVAKARRGLDRAAARGEIFHLWFHPWNLARDPNLIVALEQVLAYAARLREKGKLAAMPMADLAALAQDRQLVGARRAA